jgi:hypothetical protein
MDWTWNVSEEPFGKLDRKLREAGAIGSGRLNYSPVIPMTEGGILPENIERLIHL